MTTPTARSDRKWPGQLTDAERHELARLQRTLEGFREACETLSTAGPKVRRFAQDIFVRHATSGDRGRTDDPVVFDLVLTARSHRELQGANREFNSIAACFASADALTTLLDGVPDNHRRIELADIIARMILERAEDSSRQRSALLDAKRVHDTDTGGQP